MCGAYRDCRFADLGGKSSLVRGHVPARWVGCRETGLQKCHDGVEAAVAQGTICEVLTSATMCETVKAVERSEHMGRAETLVICLRLAQVSGLPTQPAR